MNGALMLKDWKLNTWLNRINKVEDYFIPIIENISKENNIDNILSFNYARTVLCLKEIITLLKSGFPDGALTIARTAYEFFIITKFIYKKYKTHDENKLIERYFASIEVKSYKNLKGLYSEMLEHYKKKNTENTPETLQNRIENKIEYYNNILEEFKKKYGEIKNDYWWAENELDAKSNFNEIKKDVSPDFMLHALYKRACISIHANAISPLELLGRDNKQKNILYTNQTYNGFEPVLLLGMLSHDNIVEIMCKHWNIKLSDVLSDMSKEYNDYANNLDI